MRVIYKILLGMLIFNILYVSLAGFFPTGDVDDITTVGDDGLPTDYNITEGFDLFNLLITALSTFLLSAGALALGGWLSGGSISISAGSLIGISTIATLVVTIWSSFSGVFGSALLLGDTGGYTIVSGLFTIFNIVFGIIVALTLAEMFSGQSGVDT